MKKIIVILLLAAAFLGGYQMGRSPGSPDIVGEAQQAYQQARVVIQQCVAVVQGAEQNPSKP